MDQGIEAKKSSPGKENRGGSWSAERHATECRFGSHKEEQLTKDANTVTEVKVSDRKAKARFAFISNSMDYRLKNILDK